MSGTVEGREVACPECRAAVPVDPDYPAWCDACGWNVGADESPADLGPFARAYAAHGRRQARQLFEELCRQPALARTRASGDLAAFALAMLIHGLTLAIAALGLAALVFFWPNPLGFLAAAILFAVAWGLAPHPPPPPDLLLDRRDFPALYGLADAVAAALDAGRVDGIAAEFMFNAAFRRAGWQRRNYVRLGVPLWAILDEDERVALIAHELAHGAHRAADRGFVVGGALTALRHWSVILNPPLRIIGFDIIVLIHLASRCLSLVPRGLLFLLSHLLWRGAQRAEYRVDRRAATIAGSEAVVALLRKLQFGRDYRHVVQWVAQGSNKGGGLFEALRRRTAWVPARELERRHRAAQAGEARLDVTHPPVADRIALLQAHPAAPSVAVAFDRARLAAETATLETFFERNLVRFYGRPRRWG
ncbi:MAG TPA: M48 family metalloprotease [Thermomicrobiales bacterium]|nr:M48 family metalloprotease [Thermomicrobiales bacterium]